jgi:hypothetical protein
VKDLPEWWKLNSQKRCDCSHSQEDDCYNESPTSFIKQLKSKTLTLEDENPKGLRASTGVVDMSTSRGCNVCMQYLFGVTQYTIEQV